MSEKLTVHNFEWIRETFQFNEDFKKNYMKFNIITNYINWMKREKVKKLAANLHDKTEYVIHMRYLKQTLNQGLVSKKVHRSSNSIKMLG